MRMNRTPFRRTPTNKAPRAAEEGTEVFVYDEIGFFGIQAQEFVETLRNIRDQVIVLRLNSPGGSVFDGTAMMTAIREHPARVIAHVDGLAASMASGLAMAADEVVMAKGSFIMIHDPWSVAIGDADLMRREADLLDNIADTLALNYEEKTGRDDIRELMQVETWMNHNDAVDMGFADRIAGEAEPTDSFDLSIFQHVPDELIVGKPSERQIERALRDAGLSKTEARAFVSAAKNAFGGMPNGNQDDLGGAELTDWLSEIRSQRRSTRK